MVFKYSLANLLHVSCELRLEKSRVQIHINNDDRTIRGLDTECGGLTSNEDKWDDACSAAID